MGDVIFDMDGTLMNIEHRRHHVEKKPKNWPAFRRDMHKDTPNHDVVAMAKLLKAAGNRIIISSGRDDIDKDVTVKQLEDNGVHFDAIYMRKKGDNRSDDIVKGEMLDQMIADGFNPTMAFDDRDQVVKMWRERGLRCFQVAPGDF